MRQDVFYYILKFDKKKCCFTINSVIIQIIFYSPWERMANSEEGLMFAFNLILVYTSCIHQRAQSDQLVIGLSVSFTRPDPLFSLYSLRTYFPFRSIIGLLPLRAAKGA